MLHRGGIAVSHPVSGKLDPASVLLTACSTLPLLAWRSWPTGVFTATAAASAMLNGLGYPVGLALGPAASLYHLAASRDHEDPWTRGMTAMVVGLFTLNLAAAALGHGGFHG